MNETLRTFRALMRTKGHINLRASGFSMFPYIREGDVCHFSAVTNPLQVGQIGLVASTRGILFSHRLQKVENTDAKAIYGFRGDLNPFDDEPVGSDQVIGVLTELSRKGRMLTEERRSRRMWSALAIRLPLAFRAFAYLCHHIIERLPDEYTDRRSVHAIRGSNSRH